jgi:hypothetical protein
MISSPICSAPQTEHVNAFCGSITTRSGRRAARRVRRARCVWLRSGESQCVL